MHLLAKQGVTPGGREPEIWVAETKLEYDSLLAKAILNLQAEIDQGTSGGITVSPLQTLWFRR